MSRPYGKKGYAFHNRSGPGSGGGGVGILGNGNNNGSRGGGRAGGGGGGGRFNNHHHGGGNRNNSHSDANNSGSSGGADVMKVLLSLLFEKSYSQIFNEANGLLNLSNTRASPDLEPVQKRVDYNSVAFCKVLAEVLREKFADRIRVLQLDDNSIRQLKVFLTALADADIHRGITAISARNNSINDLSFVSGLKRYDGLNELLLIGNPVTNQKDYSTRLSRDLPRLSMIDGVAVDRALLRLPNPVNSAPPSQQQLSVLHYLEQTMFQSMASRNYDAITYLYGSQFSALSISRGPEPLPQRVPVSAVLNTGDLEKQLRNQMQADVSKLRSSQDFRNLATDSAGSMRNIAKGPQEIVSKLRSMCGGDKSIAVEIEFNPNFNMVMMDQSYHMRVPVCIVTVHGKMRYLWNPIRPETQQPTFPAGKAPMISTFFDRTLTLTWDGNTNAWSIANDMVLMRPDRAVVHDDGTPSSPLFFANTPSRIEQMRRRLMPGITADVMAVIVNATSSDEEVKQSIMQLLMLPQDQLHAVASDPEAAKRALAM
ncbi:conserved hypothetical protein [Leishmania major strain Friedlin]|uniref:MEX67-like NTF2-like domain-containing protein n=1 Tax=Leishmania major TaxID=5664 RepID=E9ADE7_LEIMA|nr:conserved hypothetical protein [Leishmania major strain Friedlin]CAG9576775.1 hypothetical_protein_-_conserved [Leishmania major strain Friedlin]CBZ12235.1 conserved hypothetical protein [Leishmania major strain Friedlin]|eukprot:XP_003721976.1 conserved hypothetical protein [Leishmania major strain Friedlin]